MDEPTKVEVEIPKEEFLVTMCEQCGGETRHKVMTATRAIIHMPTGWWMYG